MTFEFVNNVCHYYLNEFYEYALQYRIESKSNFAKPKVPFWKTNMGQKGLSYIGPSLWDQCVFKHNLKKQYLGNLAGSQD